MTRMVSVFLSVSLIFLLSACQQKNDVSSLTESVSDFSSEEKYVEEPQMTSPTEVVILKDIYDYSECFDFSIPEFPEADASEISATQDSEWCVNGNSYMQTICLEQVFINDKNTAEFARAIALSESNVIYSHRTFKDFSSISEADNEFILYVSIKSTPSISINSVPENNVVSNIYNYLISEYDIWPTEIYSVKDVEKTFHYLFGENSEFIPENLENHGYRYVPEAGIFICFFETASPTYTFPQIISYTVDEERYCVKAVHTSSFDYDENGKVIDNIDIDGFLENPCFCYIFERAEDEHLVLISIVSSQN